MEKNSIDEIMVPFKGRFSGIKQYMREKPNARGFKIWCRTGTNGMLYDFEVYQGRNADMVKTSEFGLAGETVMKLCASLPKQKNHKVHADNFFTSIPLVNQLDKDGIQYVGTIRSNRLHGCDINDEKILKKNSRGPYDYRMETNIQPCGR